MAKSRHSRVIHTKSIVIVSCIAIVAMVIWLLLATSITDERSAEAEAADVQHSGKPVIVVLFDSLMSQPLQQSIEEGRAPAFSFLIKNGDYYSDVVSSYPTMSVTIDSSILTGSYPDQHRVPGLLWFDAINKQIISYGSGPHEVYENGVKDVLQHNTIHLNQEHLSRDVTTVYEELKERQIAAASINGLIYRGDTAHQLHVPQMFSHMGLLPGNITVNGPQLLSLGVLSQYNKENDSHNYAWDRYGFNNTFTVNEISHLIALNKLPPFTLAYMPDADAKLHKHGPTDLDAIEHADQTLQQLFNVYGSWEKALQEVIWIVLGDSGQSPVGDDKKECLLNMNELLMGYSLWSKKEPEGQLAFALNERMGYIYLLDDKLTYDEMVDVLKQDKRISFLAWREQGRNIVVSPHYSGSLRYTPQGKFKDTYNQTWNIEGELDILDLDFGENNRVVYGQYPDALARLHGALHAQQGRFIIVDLKPTYELQDRSSYNHVGGGSHGSLHELDSLVPLIAVGTDSKLQDKRLVALKQWLLDIVLRQAEVGESGS